MTYLHETYLRFTADELLARFAEVKSAAHDERFLAYYRKSLAAHARLGLVDSLPARERPKAIAAGNQLQKDERFWIADTLMTSYYRGNPVAAFAALLRRSISEQPSFGGFRTWEDALGEAADLELYFEVSLPSPASYQTWLRSNLADRSLVPYLTGNAGLKGNYRLEGSTKVDAILISRTTGFATLFEGKVLSDVSTHITFDATRNQLARNIDVMLEKNLNLAAPLQGRDPDKTCLVLLTPEVLKQNATSRLYGWLMPQYQSGLALLTEHLEHRAGSLPSDLPDRLGWLTWEDCAELVPNSCPWLPLIQHPDMQRDAA